MGLRSSSIRSEIKDIKNLIEAQSDKLTIRMTKNMTIMFGVMTGILVSVQKFL